MTIEDGCDPVLKLKSSAVLAFACHQNPQVQELRLRLNLVPICVRLLEEKASSDDDQTLEIWKGLCLCLGKIITGHAEGIAIPMGVELTDLLFEMFLTNGPELRAAVIFALRTQIWHSWNNWLQLVSDQFMIALHL